MREGRSGTCRILAGLCISQDQLLFLTLDFKSFLKTESLVYSCHGKNSDLGWFFLNYYITDS